MNWEMKLAEPTKDSSCLREPSLLFMNFKAFSPMDLKLLMLGKTDWLMTSKLIPR